MTGADYNYIKRIVAHGLVSSPVLELGTGYGGSTCRELIRSTELSYYGTDVEKSQTVDFVADFERLENLQMFSEVMPFGTILILNILEHTFDPIRVLDNALMLLKPRGSLVIITPAVWTLHDYPLDVWRIMPNFYEEYASRRRLQLLRDHFEYVGYGRVDIFRNPDATHSFPKPTNSKLHYWYSRIIHKVFNTFGRGVYHPGHIAIGAVLVKSQERA